MYDILDKSYDLQKCLYQLRNGINYLLSTYKGCDDYMNVISFDGLYD